MISRSDIPRTRLGSQERGFISKGMAGFRRSGRPDRASGADLLMGFHYFRWHDFMQISYSVLQVFPE
jgi:hypothetical protein